MTIKNNASNRTVPFSVHLRGAFYALGAIFCFSLFTVALTGNADAATKKVCANYVSKQSRHSCLIKHARFHGRHVVYTHPQPASFVMDATTGKVLESENADSPRYPASLTKMMTLYLTFESLKKGQMAFDQQLPVSRHAASQPQTNIALQPGDRLAVKDAILAIVVRSANDAAVTLGEAMGGSEEGFAVKMTAKAHALGMRNTVFYNASGLPEPRQHTTARDMAILGLALRKDFPQYYPFFKTESFSYNGVTYPTHNHVMMRYDGVDGIKTGYIRASGFNLVTSAKKDNYTLIGVVLGGPTWKERDDKMIAMLDRNFAQLVAQNSTTTQMAVQKERQPMIASNSKLDKAFEGEDVPEGQGDLSAENEAPAASKGVTLDSDSQKAAVTSLATNWGIQVGAYARKSEAVSAVSSAIKEAPKTLGAAQVSIENNGSTKSPSYRARLGNLTQLDAANACKELAVQKVHCFTYKE